MADAAGVDMGIVRADSGDLDIGPGGRGDLSLSMGVASVPEPGCWLHDPLTGTCGRVTGAEASTGSGVATVTGDSWTGVLGCHVVGPDAGHDYLTLSGDVADVVAQVVERAGLSGMVRVTGSTGVSVTHTLTGSRDATQRDAGRYMSGLSAVWQVLREHGCAMEAGWADGRVALSVRVAADWSGDEAAYVGLATVKSKRGPSTNHLVCLGRGELHERERVDVYADARGSCGTGQTIFGADERAEVYEYSGSDSLLTDGLAKLRGMQGDATEVTVLVESDEAPALGIGDRVGGTDPVTGEAVMATVTECIARVSGDRLRMEYKTTTEQGGS